MTNNPFVGTNRIRFVGYDLSPSGRAPLCLPANIGIINEKRNGLQFFVEKNDIEIGIY